MPQPGIWKAGISRRWLPVWPGVAPTHNGTGSGVRQQLHTRQENVRPQGWARPVQEACWQGREFGFLEGSHHSLTPKNGCCAEPLLSFRESAVWVRGRPRARVGPAQALSV